MMLILLYLDVKTLIPQSYTLIVQSYSFQVKKIQFKLLIFAVSFYLNSNKSYRNLISFCFILYPTLLLMISFVNWLYVTCSKFRHVLFLIIALVIFVFGISIPDTKMRKYARNTNAVSNSSS